MTRLCTKCDHEWSDHYQAYNGRHGCSGWSGWHDSDGCSCDGFSDDPRHGAWGNADHWASAIITDLWSKEVANVAQPSSIVSRVNREWEAAE